MRRLDHVSKVHIGKSKMSMHARGSEEVVEENVGERPGQKRCGEGDELGTDADVRSKKSRKSGGSKVAMRRQEEASPQSSSCCPGRGILKVNCKGGRRAFVSASPDKSVQVEMEAPKRRKSGLSKQEDASHIVVAGKKKGKITEYSATANDSRSKRILRGLDNMSSKGKGDASKPFVPCLGSRKVADVVERQGEVASAVQAESTPFCSEIDTRVGKRSRRAARDKENQRPDLSSVSTSDSGLRGVEKNSEKAIPPCTSCVAATSASLQITKSIRKPSVEAVYSNEKESMCSTGDMKKKRDIPGEQESEEVKKINVSLDDAIPSPCMRVSLKEFEEFLECSGFARESVESVGDIVSSSQSESKNEMDVDTDEGVYGEFPEKAKTSSVGATDGEGDVGTVHTFSVSGSGWGTKGAVKEYVPIPLSSPSNSKQLETSLNSVEIEKESNESSRDKDTACPPFLLDNSKKPRRKFRERVLSVNKACEGEKEVYEAPLTEEQVESLNKLFVFYEEDVILHYYMRVQDLMRRCPGAVVDTLMVPKKSQMNESRKLKVKIFGKMTSLKDVNTRIEETVICPVIKFKYGCAPEKETKVDGLQQVAGYQDKSGKKNFVPRRKLYSVDHSKKKIERLQTASMSDQASSTSIPAGYTEWHLVKIPPDPCSKPSIQASATSTLQNIEWNMVDVSGQELKLTNRPAEPYPQAVQFSKVLVINMNDAVPFPEPHDVQRIQALLASEKPVHASVLPGMLLKKVKPDGKVLCISYSDQCSAARQVEQTVALAIQEEQVDAVDVPDAQMEMIAIQQDQTEPVAIEQSQVQAVATQQKQVEIVQQGQRDHTVCERTTLSTDVEAGNPWRLDEHLLKPVAGTLPLPTGSDY